MDKLQRLAVGLGLAGVDQPESLVDALARRKAQFRRDILRSAIAAGSVSPLTPPTSVERWLEEMWRLYEGERPLGMRGPRVWELPGYEAGEKL